MSKKLAKKIEQKLAKLQEYLDSVTEAQVIDSNDPDTWDSDTLYNLTEELQAALKLLQDQKTNQRNQFGELITEPGLCSLIDDWEVAQEEENDD